VHCSINILKDPPPIRICVRMLLTTRDSHSSGKNFSMRALGAALARQENDHIHLKLANAGLEGRYRTAENPSVRIAPPSRSTAQAMPCGSDPILFLALFEMGILKGRIVEKGTT